MARKLPIGAVLCLVLSSAGAPSVVWATSRLLEGRGLVLPVEDRAGDQQTALMVERLLRRELEAPDATFELATLRDALRRLRIRDLTKEPPERLELLAAELEMDWFLAVTLYEARAEPVPHVTLAAQLLRRGDTTLPWAGFEAASGLDELSWLGLGGVESLEELATLTARRLAGQLDGESEPRPGRQRPAPGGFLLRPIDRLGAVAVVPFNSVTEFRPTLAAELVTDAFLATLHENSFDVVAPGLVDRLRREVAGLAPGEVDVETRESIAAGSDAHWILTGTVENFEPDAGLFPDPRVAFSARLLDAASGQIRWMNGSERLGSDSVRLLGRGQIYSVGRLAQQVTRSLAADLTTEETDRGRR